ncbi:hypothetical protein LshimejAT787_4300020 [Lyophyllum shimeji]|uniref:Uncharacterized protein n=1 Tax=Lyophyllum shimeji TaxID=47721 RepID=A0A9P3UVI7_LYOSH|nr:hypothetical protein LshimejAT787_4300020 [Lyophyllum shimeji]
MSGLCIPFLGYVGFRISANLCVTDGRPQLYRYYTVSQATGSIVHTAHAPGKGSLDLFSLDLPLPASFMQPESDAVSQVPAMDPEQDAWQRLVMVEGWLEDQAGQVTQILDSLNELRQFVEQHIVNPVPRSHSVDEYINEFMDLVKEAQFPDGAQLVFHFRHGLNSRIEAKVTGMVDGRLSDECVQDWIDAAHLVDYNNRANQDCHSAVTKMRASPAPPPVPQNPRVSAFCALPAPHCRPAPIAAAPATSFAPVSRPSPLAFRWTSTCSTNAPERQSSAADARSPGTSHATARTNSTSTS